MSRKNIGELMLEYGLIDENDLKEGLEYQKSHGLRLGEALVELGKVSYDDIEYILSKQLDIPFVILNEKLIYKDYVKTFSSTLLKKYNFIPLYETEDSIAIVTDDPFNDELIVELKKLKQKNVQVSVANGRKIKEFLKKIIKDDGMLESYLSEWLPKINETSFYRLDFLKKENSIVVSAFGFGLKKELFTYNSNNDFFKSIKEFFVKRNFDICYEKYANEKHELITVIPINRTFHRKIYNEIVVAARFGLIYDAILFCLNKEVFSKNCLFSTKTYVPGFRHLVFDQNIRINNMVTTIDYINNNNKFYFIGYVPKKCKCGGNGCEKCNRLGYLFEELEGYYTKDELEKFVGLNNG